MNRKIGQGTVKAERGDLAGEVLAVIATIGVVDSDGDVVTPTTFEDGWEVPVAYWGHTYGQPPLGKARIEVNESAREVRARCRFFIETQAGNEAVQTIMLMGERGEWSWGFKLLESHAGKLNGKRCRFLDAIELLEVSPVIKGASVGTRTVDAKSLTGRDLLKMSAAEIYAWADDALYADAQARVGADAGALVKRLDAELDDLVTEELGELQAVVKESSDAAPLTNLDMLCIDVARRHGDMPGYYRRAMVQGALGDLVERDLREQEMAAGVSPSGAVASERVRRWARSPARL
jgi:hypothetical protein